MIVAIAPPGPRTAPAPVGGNGTVTGTQTNTAGAAAVAGGTVQLIQGATTLTATPNGSGVYTFSSVAPGAYTVTNQPPAGFGVGDAGTFGISVSAGGTTTQDLLVTAAQIYFTDMQSFTSTGQFTNTTSPIPAGDFFEGTNHQILAVSEGKTGGSITYDATGGPSSTKAMKYHIASAGGGVSSPNSVSIQVRVNPALTLSNCYVRWTDNISSTFQNGGSGAVGTQREYKSFLVDLGSGAGGLGHIGVYYEGNDPTYFVTMDSTDRLSGNVNTTHAVNQALGTIGSWTGKWNTWVLCMENLGSSNYRLALYLNGTAIMNFTGQSFFPLQGGSVAGATQFQVGEQLNNGPDQAWDRTWKEVGMYSTRPSLLPLVP